MKIDDSCYLAKKIRKHALNMTHKARASHVGSCLSVADILAVLYGSEMRFDPSNPTWQERDRLIISKGHAAAIVYAVLAETGHIDVDELNTYSMDGSRLAGHVSTAVPGVELSTGSLGHGLPVAAGIALAAKRDKNNYRSFCVLSDGELDEGSNWEAIQFAQHFRLDNLIAIVDFNKIQSFGTVEEVSNLNPLPEKFSAFNWGVIEVDGHDHFALKQAIMNTPQVNGRPTVIIAHTIKGKGVSFMENQLLWHYRNPDHSQLEAAIAEIEATI